MSAREMGRAVMGWSARPRTVSALLAMVVLSGCADALDTATGIWSLRTVDGAALPAVVSTDGDTVTFIDRGLLLIRLNDCVLDATYTERVAGAPQQPEDVATVCEWEETGDRIALTWSPTSSATGAHDGEFLTLTNQDGLVFVYERV